MNLKNKKNLTSIIIYTMLFCMIIPLLIYTVNFKRDSPTIDNITHINTMELSINNKEWKEITLPHFFKHLKPGSKLSFRTTITPNRDDAVYVSSNFSKAKVYFDNKPVFTFGKDDNYPDFMTTPAKEIHVIETHGKNIPIEVRIDYFTSKFSSNIKIDPIMIGTPKELILERSVKYGMSWMFSLSQIIGGFSIICISFIFLFIDKKGILYTWLGLFAISSGFWFFGSNKFAITVFPNSAWLYISSYLGFSFCLMPLLRFIIHSVNFENTKPLIILETVYGTLFIVSILLQLYKSVPLHKSWLIFRYIVPIYLLLLTIFTIYERIKWKNKYAGRFIIPMLILYLSASCETVNRLFSEEKFHVTLMFQTGIFIFLLTTGILAGISMKDSFHLKKIEADLNHKKNMLDMMTEEQREHSLILAENETKISRQRHDLRHHISAIMELSKGNEQLENYLSTLMDKIPSKKERYCENEVVNAIISHYAYLCESENIVFKSLLTVPEQNDISLNSDLCVIFANLLENAYEACKRMDKTEYRFIDIKSSLNKKLLTITMDNSFNGDVTKIGEKYRSAKRNDYGIGLASIKSISQQYYGDSRFTHNSKIFYSSVYLSI